jgi:hypothetical protein
MANKKVSAWQYIRTRLRLALLQDCPRCQQQNQAELGPR